MNNLNFRIHKDLPLGPILNPGLSSELQKMPYAGLVFTLAIFSIKLIWKIIWICFLFLISLPSVVMDNGKTAPILMSSAPAPNLQQILNPVDLQLRDEVMGKISQHLFETSMRIYIAAQTLTEVDTRESGILASFGPFTSQH